jgi:uncharacterized protein (TIGR03086 family)
MIDEGAALVGGVALLERAVNYTLGSLRLVTEDLLACPTPCPGWDLRTLLAHLDDSLLALQEAAEQGQVALQVPRGGNGDPVTALRERAGRLVGAWAGAGGGPAVHVSDRSLTASILTSAGAVEVAVHGWDVARACGDDRQIPAPLAAELLELAPFFLTAADRPGRFGPPVAVSPLAGPGDRLLAFLGRRPSAT